jgi:uncharacterized membrane protein YciS (DUF1049 family)
MYDTNLSLIILMNYNYILKKSQYEIFTLLQVNYIKSIL